MLLCVRPQHLSLTPDGDHANSMVGTLRDVNWQGELTHLVLDVAGTVVRVAATPPAARIAAKPARR